MKFQEISGEISGISMECFKKSIAAKMEVALAPCADCGGDTGGIHKCPGCNSNMDSFCGTGVGEQGYGLLVNRAG